MKLHRVAEHFRQLHWTMIVVDLAIVVVGVFIGMQVSNWNAARVERSHADYLTAALHAEFRGIESELETSLGNITRYHAASRSLLTALRNGDVPPEEEKVKDWILNSVNLGRQSPRSAVYLQMVSDGDLRLIRNPELSAALIRFDQRIERNRQGGKKRAGGMAAHGNGKLQPRMAAHGEKGMLSGGGGSCLRAPA